MKRNCDEAPGGTATDYTAPTARREDHQTPLSLFPRQRRRLQPPLPLIPCELIPQTPLRRPSRLQRTNASEGRRFPRRTRVPLSRSRHRPCGRRAFLAGALPHIVRGRAYTLSRDVSDGGNGVAVQWADTSHRTHSGESLP